MVCHSSSIVYCDLMDCPQKCGAKFHNCKVDDHFLLCPKSFVSCIYAVDGCKLRMAREVILEHLTIQHNHSLPHYCGCHSNSERKEFSGRPRKNYDEELKHLEKVNGEEEKRAKDNFFKNLLGNFCRNMSKQNKR